VRSVALTREEIGTLIREIAKRNLKRIPVTNQYEFLRVKDKDIFLILHNTGKMVFQESKGVENLLDSILEKEELDVIGTDEAGKGEWYGPLVVAGVALTPEETVELRKMGISDSKGLSSFRIYEIGDFCKKAGIEREVRVISPERYNRLYEDFQKEKKNLNDILSWAHTGIIHDLLERLHPRKARVVIDKFDVGEKALPERMGKLEKFDVEIIQKIGAESEAAVAAASVLAKFTFEEEVKKLNSKFDIDLRNMNPEDVLEDVLPFVAKLHFKNVKKLLG
jgi:ribonuclease HIII